MQDLGGGAVHITMRDLRLAVCVLLASSAYARSCNECSGRLANFYTDAANAQGVCYSMQSGCTPGCQMQIAEVISACSGTDVTLPRAGHKGFNLKAFCAPSADGEFWGSNHMRLHGPPTCEYYPKNCEGPCLNLDWPNWLAPTA